MEVKERKIGEDNSNMFKKFAITICQSTMALPALRPLRIAVKVWIIYLMLFNALRSGRQALLCSTLRTRLTYGGPLCEKGSTSLDLTRRGLRSRLRTISI